MSLDNLRSGINEIDSQLVKLLAERLKLSREIGVEKARTGQSITDLSREASVIANIRRLATFLAPKSKRNRAKPLKTFSLLWSAETLRSPSFPWRIRSKAASVKHTISCWSRP